MRLLFLGTGAMVPTKQRNVSSVLLEYEGEFILMDCGEGTQRQMNLAGCNRTKVSTVLITHWHGDHVSGLIGLIQTIGHVPDPGVLRVIGPTGSKQRMEHLMQSVIFDARLQVDVTEAYPEKPTVVLDTRRYVIFAVAVEHSVPTIAFRFSEKDTRRMDLDAAAKQGITPGPLMGKLQRGQAVEVDGRKVSPESVTYMQRGRSVTYVMDTRYTPVATELAEGSDVLICESTFSASEHQEKAEAYGHLSARDAARIAREAQVRKLIITHFSQRYLDVGPLLEEAQESFQSTSAAHDFLEVSLDRD